MLDLSIIVVTYNSGSCISKCLASIWTYANGISYEVIVVDNNSIDGTPQLVSEFSEVKLIRNDVNEGFAAANNRALKTAVGKNVLILNPDMVLSEKTKLVQAMNYLQISPKVGLVSLKLLYENGKVQESARKFPSAFTFLIRGLKLGKFFYRFSFYRSKFFDAGAEQGPVEVDWVIGAFMLTSKEKMEKVGGFDNKYFMYYEDADLCLRYRKRGYKIVYLPYLSAIHSYQRESAKPVFSKLKWIHFKSFLRFFFRLNVAKSHF
jgi:GT2 family glycosyltransferase